MIFIFYVWKQRIEVVIDIDSWIIIYLCFDTVSFIKLETHWFARRTCQWAPGSPICPCIPCSVLEAQAYTTSSDFFHWFIKYRLNSAGLHCRYIFLYYKKVLQQHMQHLLFDPQNCLFLIHSPWLVRICTTKETELQMTLEN